MEVIGLYILLHSKAINFFFSFLLEVLCGRLRFGFKRMNEVTFLLVLDKKPWGENLTSWIQFPRGKDL